MNQYPDKCPACHKAMEVEGFIQPYPPRQLDTVNGCTRWECPHCGTAVGGNGDGAACDTLFSQIPFPFYLDTSFDGLVQKALDDYNKRLKLSATHAWVYDPQTRQRRLYPLGGYMAFLGDFVYIRPDGSLGCTHASASDCIGRVVQIGGKELLFEGEGKCD